MISKETYDKFKLDIQDIQERVDEADRLSKQKVEATLKAMTENYKNKDHVQGIPFLCSIERIPSISTLLVVVENF